MNYDPNAIKVLCYGDSNTWGQKPDKTGRYPSDVRWTGKLQELLGDNYYVIEEGLGSRTTDLDYSKPGRNGKTYMKPCLESHNPIDVVVLMLGTNDLKMQYGRSPKKIASALNGLIEDIRNIAKDKVGASPKIILMSPILINSSAPDYYNFYSEHYNEESASNSKGLSEEIGLLAKSEGCEFLDASKVSQPGSDGLHFDEESHPALGAMVAKKVKDLFN